MTRSLNFISKRDKLFSIWRYGAIKERGKGKKKISVTARGIQIFIKSFCENSARLFFMGNPGKDVKKALKILWTRKNLKFLSIGNGTRW